MLKVRVFFFFACFSRSEAFRLYVQFKSSGSTCKECGYQEEGSEKNYKEYSTEGKVREF